MGGTSSGSTHHIHIHVSHILIFALPPEKSPKSERRTSNCVLDCSIRLGFCCVFCWFFFRRTFFDFFWSIRRRATLWCVCVCGDAAVSVCHVTCEHVFDMRARVQFSDWETKSSIKHDGKEPVRVCTLCVLLAIVMAKPMNDKCAVDASFIITILNTKTNSIIYANKRINSQADICFSFFFSSTNAKAFHIQTCATELYYGRCMYTDTDTDSERYYYCGACKRLSRFFSGFALVLLSQSAPISVFALSSIEWI